MPLPRSAALDESAFPSRLLTFSLALTIFTFDWFGWLIVDLRDAHLIASGHGSPREHR